ncbi:MAG: hypothetical protein WCJ29_04735 [bacterium]
MENGLNNRIASVATQTTTKTSVKTKIVVGLVAAGALAAMAAGLMPVLQTDDASYRASVIAKIQALEPRVNLLESQIAQCRE